MIQSCGSYLHPHSLPIDPHMTTSPLSTEELHYELPSSLIATEPVRPRDSARMMVIHRETGRTEHRLVSAIGEYLQQGDLLCMNNTAVLPARLMGRRTDSGGRVEGLVLDSSGPTWRLMLKSNGTLRIGQSITLHGPGGEAGEIELVERDGACWMATPTPGTELSAIGHTPIPPYILRSRSDDASIPDHQDRDWYETVYADATRQGSVAAPTAGFHFTEPLLGSLAAGGVDQAFVTLDVGAGTFTPISTELVSEHVMHAESWSIEQPALHALASRRGDATGNPGRIVAVGTTTVRVLESLPDPIPSVAAGGETDLMILPGWEFRHVDALLTNFHLPGSTLLALVGAFMGLDELKAVYEEAVEEGYRFYSYGDAMLIL